jgi:hypothetical protein
MKTLLQACGRCAHCLRRAQVEVVYQERHADGRLADPAAERRCTRHAARGHDRAAIQARTLPPKERAFPGHQRPWLSVSVLPSTSRSRAH